jgi:DnaJ homolog subfamily A member 2
MVCETELYDILEINPNASEDDIKKSYKKLAFKYHPDRNKNSDSKEKFQKIQTAYETLIDKNKRELYDKYGKNMDKQQEQENHFNPFSNLFDMMNGNVQHRQQNVNKQTVPIQISIEDLYTGCIKKLRITSKQKCENCNATVTKCQSCNGNGFKMMIRQMGPMMQQIQVECEECNKTGKKINKSNCNNCKGHGTIKHTFERELVLNKNEDYLKEFKFENIGDYNFETKKNNDIYIQIKLKENIFKINKYDIIFEYSINLHNALTGKNIVFEHPNKKNYIFTTNNCIKDNSVKIIPKLGLPTDYSFGNLIIKFNYNYPTELLTIEELKNSFIDEEDCDYEKLNLMDIEEYKNNDEEEREVRPQCQQS